MTINTSGTRIISEEQLATHASQNKQWQNCDVWRIQPSRVQLYGRIPDYTWEERQNKLSS